MKYKSLLKLLTVGSVSAGAIGATQLSGVSGSGTEIENPIRSLLFGLDRGKLVGSNATLKKLESPIFTPYLVKDPDFDALLRRFALSQQERESKERDLRSRLQSLEQENQGLRSDVTHLQLGLSEVDVPTKERVVYKDREVRVPLNEGQENESSVSSFDSRSDSMTVTPKLQNFIGETEVRKEAEKRDKTAQEVQRKKVTPEVLSTLTQRAKQDDESVSLKEFESLKEENEGLKEESRRSSFVGLGSVRDNRAPFQQQEVQRVDAPQNISLPEHIALKRQELNKVNEKISRLMQLLDRGNHTHETQARLNALLAQSREQKEVLEVDVQALEAILDDGIRMREENEALQKKVRELQKKVLASDSSVGASADSVGTGTESLGSKTTGSIPPPPPLPSKGSIPPPLPVPGVPPPPPFS